MSVYILFLAISYDAVVAKLRINEYSVDEINAFADLWYYKKRWDYSEKVHGVTKKCMEDDMNRALCLCQYPNAFELHQCHHYNDESVAARSDQYNYMNILDEDPLSFNFDKGTVQTTQDLLNGRGNPLQNVQFKARVKAQFVAICVAMDADNKAQLTVKY